MRILVVENDVSIRGTLKIILEIYKHQVDLVINGESALQYLEKEWPDVILLDLILDGMDGEELLRQILIQFGKLPYTIIVSALNDVDSVASRYPGTRFLNKPYTIEELISMIDDASFPQEKKYVSNGSI